MAARSQPISQLHGAVPIFFPPTLGTVVWSGRLTFFGWAFVNNGSVTADVVIRDGLDPTGVPLAQPQLAAGTSDEIFYPEPGVQVERGIYVQPSGAFINGTIYIRPVSLEPGALPAIVGQAAGAATLRAPINKWAVQGNIDLSKAGPPVRRRT